MIAKPECYKCKCSSGDVILVMVHAPGQFFICENCINEIEEEDNKVALYHPLKGLSFFTKEEAELILEERPAKVELL